MDQRSPKVFFYPRDVCVSAVFAVERWLSVRPSVIRRYCIQPARYNYKSNILNTVRLGTKLLKNTNRKPYTMYRIMVQLSITLISRLRHYSTLNISETTRDRAIVTILNINRKSYALYLTATFPMTLTDP